MCTDIQAFKSTLSNVEEIKDLCIWQVTESN